MTAMSELVLKAERVTGNRAKAVQMATQWTTQFTECTVMTKEQAAAHILRELEKRRRARVTQ